MSNNKLLKTVTIMGLGNPGEEYMGTPHNTGFEVIDLLQNDLEKEGVEFKESETKKTRFLVGRTDSKKVVLAKPLTFMNRSGLAVKELAESKKLNPKSFILVHDDADIPAGSIRISYGSSSGGHKGVKDVISKLKTKDFYRFRVGIGNQRRPKKRTKKQMNNLVIKKVGGKKKKDIKKSQKLCAQLIHDALIEGEIPEQKNFEA
ncbi:MAG: aminoacyl-tRNA hydrolase [Candidatus Spechtbacterales bacterium]|nr:aminoacyl-tRNA hydrolase [Candidatus Spechtbacterales bacterium]